MSITTINPFANRSQENLEKDVEFLSEMNPPNKLGWKKEVNEGLAPSKWTAPFSEKKRLFRDFGKMIQDANRTIYSNLSNTTEIVDSTNCSELAIKWAQKAVLHILDLTKVAKTFIKYSEHFADIQMQNNKREKQISYNFQIAAKVIDKRPNQGLVDLIEAAK